MTRHNVKVTITAVRTYNDHTSDAYFENGILRWTSNDRVPPEDLLEHFLHTGQIDLDNFRKSVNAKEIELRAFLEAREVWLQTAEGSRADREARMMARNA